MKNSPKGYLQFRIMVAMTLYQGISSRHIRKLAKEIKHGPNTFDPVADRGYYSSPFRGVKSEKGSHCMRAYGEGWISKYCYRHTNNLGITLYSLNQKGYDLYAKLALKWGGIYEDTIWPKKVDGTLKENEFAELASENKWDEARMVEYVNGKAVIYGKAGETSKPQTNPVLPLRGLKVDDDVVYYRKSTRESGEGYISSMKIHSKLALSPKKDYISVTNIDQITYDEERDMFLEKDGTEIQIIKK